MDFQNRSEYCYFICYNFYAIFKDKVIQVPVSLKSLECIFTNKGHDMKRKELVDLSFELNNFLLSFLFY